MKNKQLLTACLMLLSVIPAQAQYVEWIDRTSLIANPTFDAGNATGWTETHDGSMNFNAQCMEVWNGNFDVYQNLTGLPNGKYRLGVSAYYRVGSNDVSYRQYQSGTENITAYLYANATQQPLLSTYSVQQTTASGDGWWASNGSSGPYFPNNMATAQACFSAGQYRQTMEVEVTDGTLRFGIRNTNHQNNSWAIWDNFTLEYWGEVVCIDSITIGTGVQNYITGEVRQLPFVIYPANATFQNLIWSSSNETVATVDGNGVVTALKSGLASITATSRDPLGASARRTIRVRDNAATAETLIINEVQASNVDMFVDPSWNYGSWIELYNPTDFAAGISGYYVSDDETNLKKFKLSSTYGVVPGHGYRVIWFDHHEDDPTQVNFKLSPEGGSIYISSPQGVLLSSQTYPATVSRTSYARRADGGDIWGMTAQPTPGASNATSTFSEDRLAAPQVDKDAQFFTGTLQVVVSIPQGATLKYTTDGSAPSDNNGMTSLTGIFSISQTTTFRFRLFQDGMLPSAVVTRSYLRQDREYTLPVVSIVTDAKHLYSDEMGIFVRGVNGRPGLGQSTPCNWNMEWERPVNFELITPTNQMAFNQEVHISAAGGWSRAWEPHSYKLKADRVFENLNSMDYAFFADKPYNKHKVLQIRNGGNDNYWRLKDALLQMIVSTSGLKVEYQAYQPVVQFINGAYAGVINMREPNNKHYAYSNYGYDDDLVDQFEMSPDSGYVQKEGTPAAFLELVNLSTEAASDEVYEEICQRLDIDEYINYMAVELYLGGNDWPHNNSKAFRSRVEDGRFRFVLFDLDASFARSDPFTAFQQEKTYTFNWLYDKQTQITQEVKVVTLFLNLLKNDTFRKRFIDTFCLVAGSVFDPARVNAVVDELVARVSPMMAYDGLYPASNSGSSSNAVKNSLAGRQSTLINSMRAYSPMKLTQSAAMTAQLSTGLSDGRIYVNGIEVPTGAFSGTLFSPVTLSASAPAGYRFAGWKSVGAAASKTILSLGSSWNYYTSGSLDGVDWTSATFSDRWSTGLAPLGYATSDVNNTRGLNTQLDYGTNAAVKRPTYYFRQTVNLATAPASDDVFTLNYAIDDGFVIYVNGTEAGRVNMPAGAITYNTYSSAYASDAPLQGTMTLATELFKKGSNVIAVEVHNTSASSSDIYWDASLSQSSVELSGSIVSTSPDYELTAGRTYNLRAIYEPLTAEELAASGMTPVRVNEVSAANSIHLNEYFKKNDWVELYNTTDEDIDLEGMYLSDNADKPQKYVISAEATETSTIIPARGYRIIWCDKLEPLSQLHATFKLAAEGGDVVLTAADRSWSDTFHYTVHEGTQSMGRYPDGTDSIYVMTLPTIDTPNVLTSYATLYVYDPIAAGIDDVHLTTDGSLSLHLVGESLLVRDEEATSATLSIYAASGQLVREHRLRLTDDRASVAIADLPTGTYIARATSSTGQQCSVKFIHR